MLCECWDFARTKPPHFVKNPWVKSNGIFRWLNPMICNHFANDPMGLYIYIYITYILYYIILYYIILYYIILYYIIIIILYYIILYYIRLHYIILYYIIYIYYSTLMISHHCLAPKSGKKYPDPHDFPGLVTSIALASDGHQAICCQRGVGGWDVTEIIHMAWWKCLTIKTSIYQPMIFPLFPKLRWMWNTNDFLLGQWSSWS